MKILEVKNISIFFEEKQVLKNIFLHLNKGELVSILGASGVGKTTLFNVIAGLIDTNSGEVLLNGENIIGKSGKMSYMLQKDLLLPFKTIIENVSLPLIIKGEKKKEAQKKAKQYFEIFGLEGMENKYPKELSGGMRQRAALLRTYMFSSEVALLDEPFSALDAITKHKMQSWYLEIMKKIKMSTLFITHDIDEAILLSERIYILSGKPGEIVKEIKIELDKEKFSKENLDSKNKNEELMMSEKFLNYKREILKLL